ncbi:site-specific integrase [Nocardia tengchongensis]
MSSFRVRTRPDTSTYTQILFRHNGKQASRSWDDHATALRWKELLDKVGSTEAIAILDAQLGVQADGTPTLKQWLLTYIDCLTGVEAGTIDRYKAMVRNDFDETISALPVTAITDAVVACWIQGLVASGASGKTVANKHGFLSAALAVATIRKIIPANPCAATRLPRANAPRMTFLEVDEFRAILDAMPERWRPFTLFLVTSGARFSEAAALTVGDVNVRAGTCRIDKAWKDTRQKGGNQWQLGLPKTKKSIRTINLPPETLAELDLKRAPNERLFLNTRGKAMRSGPYYHTVWKPAVRKAEAALNGKDPRPHDLRHSCASWMISAGVPLPVIQAHLGHESITTTIDRYGHLDRQAGAAAASAMSAMLSGGQPSPGGTPPRLVVVGSRGAA